MSEKETPGIHVTLENDEVKVTVEGDLTPLAVPTILRIAAKNVERTLGID